MSLIDRFAQSCRDHAAKIATIDANRRLSYAELGQYAAGLMEPIAAQTERPNIGLMVPNNGGFPAAFFATLMLGRVPVPLNYLLTARELAAIIADAEIDTIVTTQFFEKHLAGLGLKLLVLETTGPIPPARRPAAPGDDDVAVLLYTSGTTGEPKGVELTHRNILADGDGAVALAKIHPEQVFLALLPMFHTFALTGTMIVPLLLGSTTVFLPRFSPAEVYRAIHEHRVSVMMAVPSMYGALCRAPDLSRYNFASLDLCISGGEPLPSQIRERFEAIYGPKLFEGYGLTETSPVLCLNTPDGNRPGTVGRAIPGVEIRIVDDQDAPLPVEQTGHIQARGPVVMRGYRHKPAETARVLTADGWFRTGDLGRLDTDGYLTITGRFKEIIISGGENIYPREIEEVLVQHPAVAEVAVIGEPDPSRGEVPKAIITLKSPDLGVTAAQIKEWSRDHLTGYKVPRTIEIRESLPHGPTGKILKKELRANPPGPA